MFGLVAGVCAGIPVYLAVATAMVRRNLEGERQRAPVVAHTVVAVGLVAIVVGLVTTA